MWAHLNYLKFYIHTKIQILHICFILWDVIIRPFLTSKSLHLLYSLPKDCLVECDCFIHQELAHRGFYAVFIRYLSTLEECVIMENISFGPDHCSTDGGLNIMQKTSMIWKSYVPLVCDKVLYWQVENLDAIKVPTGNTTLTNYQGHSFFINNRMTTIA